MMGAPLWADEADAPSTSTSRIPPPNSSGRHRKDLQILSCYELLADYAIGGEPSKLEDIYSYGILVLEIFTRRRPTDKMFKDDFNLHNFIKTTLPDRLVQIVDSSLLPRGVEENVLRASGEGRNYSGNNEGIEIEVEGNNAVFVLSCVSLGYLNPLKLS